MEAWIAHIRLEWINEVNDTYNFQNKYSAWATEKQALKSVSDWLRSEILRPWGGNTFAERQELQDAVVALLEAEKFKEAIGLMNRYTFSEKRIPGKTSTPHKITITIQESKFLGSAFE